MNFPFHPQINEVSRMIAHPLKQEFGTASAEDALIKYGQLVKERREQRRLELLIKEREECHFRP